MRMQTAGIGKNEWAFGKSSTELLDTIPSVKNSFW